MKKLINDSRGVTLLEVILGIVILGIIVVPLLRTFVVGAHSSRKSAQLASATTAAQNLVEKIEATDSAVLLKNAALLGADAQYCTKTDDGNGNFTYTPIGPVAGDYPDKTYYIQVPAVSSGNGDFAALVTLDGNTEANGLPMSVGNQMDAAVRMKTYDSIAEIDYVFECTEYDEDGKPINFLSINDLTRSISVETTCQNRDETNKTADYTLDVTFTYQNMAEGFNRSYTTREIVTKVKDTEYGQAAFSLFLFYDAFYKNTQGYTENIEIKNPHSSNIDYNVFLVNSDTTTEVPSGYRAQVEYKNQKYNDGETQCRVFTNLPADKVSYRAYRGDVRSDDLTVSGYLVEQKLVDRRYFVNVKLFEIGGDMNDAPLVSLDAEKLD